MAATLMWDARSNELVVFQGATLRPTLPESHEFEGLRDDTAQVSLRDLETVFAEIAGVHSEYSGGVSLNVWSSWEPPDKHTYLHYIESREQSVETFTWHWDHALVVGTDVTNPAVRDMDGVAVIAGPLLRESAAELLDMRYNESGSGYLQEAPFIHLRLAVKPVGTLERILRLTDHLRELLHVSALDPRTPSGARALILSGSAEALLGQAESNWLEAKQKGYWLSDDGRKHELAMDLAALANTDTGGLLVVGMRTDRDAARQDVIKAVPGCTPGSLSVDAYTQVAKHRIVPNIDGLEIQVVDRRGRHILVAYIPPQPEYLQPFLVRGGITNNDKVSGAAFTIPRRVGSEKWNLSAEAIHSMLVAARAALRTGQYPTEDR